MSGPYSSHRDARLKWGDRLILSDNISQVWTGTPHSNGEFVSLHPIVVDILHLSEEISRSKQKLAEKYGK